MTDPIKFYGPIRIYVRKEDDDWIACVDPFGAAGDGDSPEAAIDASLLNLRELLEVIAEEIHTHGPDRVAVLSPLADVDRENPAYVYQAYIWAAATPLGEGIYPTTMHVNPLSETEARHLLADNRQIAITPPVAVPG